jgi:hypothetical protein
MRKVMVLALLTLALAFAAPSGVNAGGGGSDGCGGNACHSVGGGGGGSRGGGGGGATACVTNPSTDGNSRCHGGGGGRPYARAELIQREPMRNEAPTDVGASTVHTATSRTSSQYPQTRPRLRRAPVPA